MKMPKVSFTKIISCTQNGISSRQLARSCNKLKKLHFFKHLAYMERMLNF